MFSKKQFSQELEALISLVEAELTNRKKGISGEGSVGQLETFILPILKEIMRLIKYVGEIPETLLRINFHRYIMDATWKENPDDPEKPIVLWDIWHPSEMHLKLLNFDDKLRNISAHWDEWQKLRE